MAVGRETTRQRMINIMYLVLLAMLALNVSDTILNAFKNIDSSLEVNRDKSAQSIEQMLANFEQTKAKEDPANNVPLLNKAKQAKAISEELNTLIEGIKKKFLDQGGGIDAATNDFKLRDNLDIAQHILVSGKEGKLLQDKINQTKEKLINLLDKEKQMGLTITLEALDNGKGKSWLEQNFGEGIPLTAANTILTKIQNDLRDAQGEVINRLLSEQPIVVLNQFNAVAVAPSSYVIQGQPYTAEVFLTAYDKNSDADIFVNGNKVSVVDGKGRYTVNTNSVGVFNWTGSIQVKNNKTGKVDTYATPTQTYQVAKPSSNVSSDKMNVIYAGIPNPFSVSAAGFPLESIQASANNANMSRTGAGKYNVLASGSMIGKEVTISVTAKNSGKTVDLGKTVFRVKGLPKPTATIGGRSSGDLSSVQLRNEGGIDANVADFPFNLKYRIKSFKATILRPKADSFSISVSGGNFNAELQNAMKILPVGTKVFFENIVSVGEDGKEDLLSPIVIGIK